MGGGCGGGLRPATHLLEASCDLLTAEHGEYRSTSKEATGGGRLFCEPVRDAEMSSLTFHDTVLGETLGAVWSCLELLLSPLFLPPLCLQYECQ